MNERQESINTANSRDLKTDIIEIKIPNSVESDIKQSANISETLRLQINNNVEEHKAQLETDETEKTTTNTESNNDIQDKVETLYEILNDRAQSETVTSLEEICEITEIPRADISAFMLRLNKMARKHSQKVKKLKRKKGTCYLLVK